MGKIGKFHISCQMNLPMVRHPLHGISMLDALLGFGLLMLSLLPFLVDLFPHDAQRITWTVLMAGLGTMGVAIRFRPTPAEGAVLLAFLTVGAISSSLASSPWHGWIETLSWLAMLTGIMILSRHPFTPERWARHLGLFALINGAPRKTVTSGWSARSPAANPRDISNR